MPWHQLHLLGGDEPRRIPAEADAVTQAVEGIAHRIADGVLLAHAGGRYRGGSDSRL
jgi:hypothetical protein